MKQIKVALVGTGAFGIKHLDAIKNIDDAEVVALVSSKIDSVKKIAEEYAVEHYSNNLDDVLKMPEVDCVILCTPTHLHAEQTLKCLQAGKHVEVEIPLADNLAAAEQVLKVQQQTNLVAMVGHTRRFNPSHQWIHQQVKQNKFHIQQMDVQTYFSVAPILTP